MNSCSRFHLCSKTDSQRRELFFTIIWHLIWKWLFLVIVINWNKSIMISKCRPGVSGVDIPLYILKFILENLKIWPLLSKKLKLMNSSYRLRRILKSTAFTCLKLNMLITLNEQVEKTVYVSDYSFSNVSMDWKFLTILFHTREHWCN